jgi:hypothetical protein
MKYYELKQMYDSLQKLSIVEKEIPFSTGLKIVRNVNKISNALLPFQQLQNQIVFKYSSTGELKPEDDHYKDAVKEISELLNQDTELELEKVKPSALDGFSLPLGIINALLPMLESEDSDGTENN